MKANLSRIYGRMKRNVRCFDSFPIHFGLSRTLARLVAGGDPAAFLIDQLQQFRGCCRVSWKAAGWLACFFALELTARSWHERPDKERGGHQAVKPKKSVRRSSVPSSTSSRVDRCALRVVVYCAPGPDDRVIVDHARQVVGRHSRCKPSEGLGYITLVASDFDRLRKGVERGDAFGTAYSVLRFLGPSAEQFIGREADFIFGWIGAADKLWGEMLVLEIMPRPHLLAAMN